VSTRDVAAVLSSLARYWLGILPLASDELRRWRARAHAIPHPVLRAQAVATLREEGLNVEAAAVFATLVPQRRWPVLVPLLIAFQVMYDYLDTVSEERVPDVLSNGLQLHRALAAALDPSAPTVDWYRHHPYRDDGGYLDALVATCRECLASLPSAASVLPVARRAATRCAEGQSHTHAAMQEEDAPLALWALRQDRAAGYLWWEVAAGAISSVGVYALLAAAAQPRETSADAARIDAAYFPATCALSALLDSLVDREQDLVAASLSSFGHYPSGADACARLGLIASRAEAAARELRHGRRHMAIIAGIAGYYASAAGARDAEGAPVTAAIAARLGPTVPLILATMRTRRRLAARGVSDSRGSGSRSGSRRPTPSAGSRVRGSHPRPSASARGA
jgi:tetraprenyl-beta-curcumene synthase